MRDVGEETGRERGDESRAVLMQLGVWKLKVQFSLGSLQEWCVCVSACLRVCVVG